MEWMIWTLGYAFGMFVMFILCIIIIGTVVYAMCSLMEYSNKKGYSRWITKIRVRSVIIVWSGCLPGMIEHLWDLYKHSLQL